MRYAAFELIVEQQELMCLVDLNILCIRWIAVCKEVIGCG